MKKVFLPVFLLLTVSLSAQSVERSVIAAYGASGTSGNMSVDMTVGEVAVTTGQSGSFVITQGFQQPGSGTTGIGEALDLQVNYRLYPNPATSQLILELTADKHLRLDAEIIDMRGRSTGLLQEGLDLSATGSESTWDVTGLAEGSYMLVIRSTNGERQTAIRFQKR